MTLVAGADSDFLASDHQEPAGIISDLMRSKSLTVERLLVCIQAFCPGFDTSNLDAPFNVDDSVVVLYRLFSGSIGRVFVQNAIEDFKTRADEMGHSKDIKTLQERIMMLHRKFPERRLSVYYLRKLYREHHIKKKKIR